MSQWCVERRTANNSAELGADIARHLLTRFASGTAVIVVESPTLFLSPLRKNWLRLMRFVLRERARSLTVSRIYELTQWLIELQNLPFTASDYMRSHGVVIISPSECAMRQGEANTLYLGCSVTQDQLAAITERLTGTALIVDYTGQVRAGRPVQT